jgi:hypothetical protein
MRKLSFDFMEALQDALAEIPGKYAADFTALFRDSLFQHLPDPPCRMMIAMRILRAKKRRIPFSAITSFFSVSKAQFSNIGSDSRRNCSLAAEDGCCPKK